MIPYIDNNTLKIDSMKKQNFQMAIDFGEITINLGASFIIVMIVFFNV